MVKTVGTVYCRKSYFIIKEGITEEFKGTDQMVWTGAMNNIQARAREIVNEEIIFS